MRLMSNWGSQCSTAEGGMSDGGQDRRMGAVIDLEVLDGVQVGIGNWHR